MQKYLLYSIFHIFQKTFSKLFKTLITLALLILPIKSTIACDPSGNITGSNGPIVLGSPGCGDASGNMNGTIFSGATVTNPIGDGLTALISAGHNPWNITNNGSISASGQGVSLLDGGDTVTNTGSIISSANGISAPGGAGFQPITLINSGTINATAGDSGGLLLGGATVTNQVNGLIEGGFDGLSISDNGTPVSGLTSSVDNAGTIISNATNADGIDMGLGGTVTNRATGLIDGFVAVAMKTNPSIVNNAGQIIGALTDGSTAVGMGAGGTVNNDATGQLLAQSRGVSMDGGPGIVNNEGTISIANGRAIDFGATSSGGTVNNSATGVMITAGLGTRAIIFEGGPGVVNNAGSISGGLTATIEMLSGNSTVNNSGVINGKVEFTISNDMFLMTAGTMTGELMMGVAGNEAATFQNVTDTNIGTISVFNGGGGGNDQLIFDHAQHTGGNEMTNWETINLTNASTLTLSSNLTLGGVSPDQTATLNINSSTLNANDLLNAVIQANTAHAVLVNNTGIVNAASPSINNALIIRGDYVGIGGLLALNAVLNGDSSPADKLVIDGQNGGGSATGNTLVAVHNVGGTGALTNANGILVVQAINNATTASTAFALNNPLRAGAYDYQLFRGGVDPTDPLFAQDWFLRSTSAPGSPILGPELSVYGSVLPTAMDMGRVTLGTLQEREGDETLFCVCRKRFASGWIRAFTQPYREQYSSIVNPFASGTISGLQTGINLYQDSNANRISNRGGLYFAYANADPDIEGIITNASATADIKAHTGSVNLNATTGGAYWTHFWRNGSYLDLVAQVSSYRGNADSFRTSMPLQGEGTAESAELGYPIHFARQWTLEPEAQLMHQYIKFNNSHDTFSDVDLGSSNALMGRIGTRLKYTTQINQYLVLPYIDVNFWSVLSGDNANTVYAGINAIGTAAKTSWVQLGGGITVKVSRNLSVYGFVNDLVNLGNSHQTLNGANAGLGVRFDW